MTLNRIPLVAATLILGLTISWGIPNPAVAQENSATVTFNLFSAEGVVIGETYTVDAAFGERVNVTIPAPFKYLAPSGDGVQLIFQRPAEGTTELFKLNFVTDDEKLIENMRFVKITLPMALPEDRLKILARFLVNDAFQMAVSSYEQSEFIGARDTKIGDYDAVEAVGKYIEPDLGLMYVRMVGIINPDSEDIVLAVANIVDSRAELASLDDLARTFTGTALRFFEYIEE
jgi:hypothetical protein